MTDGKAHDCLYRKERRARLRAGGGWHPSRVRCKPDRAITYFNIFNTDLCLFSPSDKVPGIIQVLKPPKNPVPKLNCDTIIPSKLPS